jgi:hypothetical protein
LLLQPKIGSGEHPRLAKLTFWYCCILVLITLIVTPMGTMTWATQQSNPSFLVASHDYLRKFPWRAMPNTPKDLYTHVQ